MQIKISPPSKYSIAADFRRAYRWALDDALVVSKTSPGRILNLRPSAMPFCPLAFFELNANRGLTRDLDLRGMFYTSVGTTVHEVMQHALCRNGRYLADYYCYECGTWHMHSYVHECCGFPTEYNEVEINYNGVEGHIDAVYKDEQGRLWILDFKTTSIKAAPVKEKNPGANYKEQIQIYAVLYELQYGERIEGFMDAFILRDNPALDPAVWAEPLTDDVRREVKAKLKRYKVAHTTALQVQTMKDVGAMYRKFGRCTDPECGLCKASDSVLKNRLKNAFRVGARASRFPLKEFVEREASALIKRAQRRPKPEQVQEKSKKKVVA